MSQATATLVHSLKRLAISDERAADSQLLRAFAESRDERAFLHLMRRHGPMVLGVCRRWLGSTPDADDAFQATFIALSQQASRIEENLPGWLHRVAQRSSRKVLRRRSRLISTDCDRWGRDDFDIERVEWRDLRRALDAELERLPARERSAIVLCLVEGLTRDEAAERLGISLRTVDRCLQRGRASLRIRLKKRGLALLAATLLTTDGLIASVPASLSESTLQAACKASPAVFVGLSMAWWFGAVGVVLTSLAAAIGLSLADFSTDEPPPGPPVEKLLVLAPAPRYRTPPDPWGKKIAPSRQLAIDYLKSVQEKDGTWEDGSVITLAQPGGQTALITLALLESGVRENDPLLKKSLEYLRHLPPRHTYVVSLCTQAYCLTGNREDQARIQDQVDWLVKGMQRTAGKFDGWSYSAQPGRGDFSNTQYAITALHAAHRAGIKVDEKQLKEIRELLVETQLKEGGWGYLPKATATHTMTCSTLFCLHMVDECLGVKEASTESMKRGLAWLDQNFAIENATHILYNLDVLSRMGRLTATTSLKERDWFQDGFDYLTSKQDKLGAIRIAGATLDNNPKLSTSLALRFYANRIR